MNNGWKERRKERWMDGTKKGAMDGRMGRKKEGWMDRMNE